VRAIGRLPAATRAARTDLVASARAVRGLASDLGLPVPDGTRRHLVATSWSLAEIKAIGHQHEATVNDVMLAAVAGGLRRMLAAGGTPVDDLTVRVSVPVAAPSGARNAGGTLPMVLGLPVDEPDPAVALAEIAVATADLKAARDPTYAGLTVSPLMPVSLARAWTRWLRRHGGQRINLFVTNVPGPVEPLRFGGGVLREVWPIAPVVAGVPLAVTVLSYAGELVLTVNASPRVGGLDDLVRGARLAVDGLGYGMYRVADSGAIAASSASS
jgi:diacylglycerol O-acyltransferase